MVLPLPFFFTRTTRDFFAVPARPSEARIDVRFASAAAAASARLVVRAVCLDTDERRQAWVERNGGQQTGQLACVTQTLVEDRVEVQAPGLTATVDLLGRGRLGGNVRDLWVLVQRADGEAEEGSAEAEAAPLGPVVQINVMLNRSLHMSLSRLLANRLVPRQLYGRGDLPPNMFVVPFCQDPLSERYSHTCDANFGRLDRASLVMRFARPGRYRVAVVGRRFDVMRYEREACAWRFLPPSDGIGKAIVGRRPD